MTATLATVTDRLGMKLELPKSMDKYITPKLDKRGVLSLEKCTSAAYKKMNDGKIEGYDEVRRQHRILTHKITQLLKDADIDTKKISITKKGVLSLSFELPQSAKALRDNKRAELVAQLAKLDKEEAEEGSVPASAAVVEVESEEETE